MRSYVAPRGAILLLLALVMVVGEPVLVDESVSGTDAEALRAEGSDGPSRPDPGRESPAGTADALGLLPATFIGMVPCADCPGIRYHLNLLPDRSYFRRTTYLDRPAVAPQDSIGTWAVSSDGRLLGLKGSRQAPEVLDIQDGPSLHVLDAEGRALPVSLPSELRRAALFEPLEAGLLVRGMYVYLADAGLFTECLTGQRWAVAQEGDNAALERAYLKARSKPGAPLLASLEGRVAIRPGVEGAGTQPTLIVERFIDVKPGGRCAPRFSNAPLQGTVWMLTRLGEQAVRPALGRPAPSLALRVGPPRLTGTGGCNRFRGTYTLNGNGLTFGPVMGTRMACPGHMAAETAFTAALGRVATWRVLGRLLELHDAQGNLLARFAARRTPR